MREKELIKENDSLRKRVAELESSLERIENLKGGINTAGEWDRLIIDNIRDMIALATIDDNMTIIDVNSAIFRILGYCRNDLLGKNAVDLVHPDDLNIALAAKRKLIEEGEGSAEFRYRKKDGSYIWMESSNRLFFDHSGKALLLLTGREISERKDAEKEIEYRLKIENSLAYAVSLLFVVPGNPDYQEILHTIGEALTADRGYICIFKDNYQNLDTMCEWCAPGTGAQLDYCQDMNMMQFPYFMNNIEGGKNIMIGDLNDIPPEAAAEKELLLSQKVSAVIMVPLYSTKAELLGIIGFDDTSKCRQWVTGDVQALEMLAEIIAVYWERQQNEAELHKARVELEQRVEERTIKLKVLNENLESEIRERRQIESQIQHRLVIEEAVSRTARLFISADEPGFQEVLRILGDALAVEQAYIFRINENEQAKTEHKWSASGIQSRLDEAQVLDILLLRFLMDELEKEKRIVISDALELPPEADKAKEYLRKHNIRSLIIVPIYSGSMEIAGFMGFDNRKSRLWLDEDVASMEVVAEMIGSYWERQQVQAALLKSEEKFRKLADTAPALIYVLQGSEFRYVNSAFEKIIGYKKEECFNRPVWDFIHPDYREMTRERSLARQEGQIIPPYETLLISKSGEEFWGYLSADIIEFEGKPAALGVIFDISERKKAEEALRKSEECFSKAFNASPQLMAITTLKEGYYIDVNERFQAFIGYKKEELIGHSADEISIWAEREERKNFIRLLKEQGGIRNLEFKMLNEGTGLLSSEILEVNGEQCVLSLITDITERIKMVQKMARMDQLNLVGEIAASIGHEIRNPMTSVRGFLQMFDENQEHREYKEIFALMIEELDRANLIITEFLSLAKNKMAVLKEQNLNTIIENIFPLMVANALAQDKSLELELGNIPLLLLDEKETRQLLFNLVRNGLEAMNHGGKVFIATYIEEDEVVLRVRDQGPGIEPGIIEKIRDPFFSTKESGTGLGLTICYSIAERHKAAIEIETSAIGSSFYIRFKY